MFVCQSSPCFGASISMCMNPCICIRMRLLCMRSYLLACICMLDPANVCICLHLPVYLCLCLCLSLHLCLFAFFPHGAPNPHASQTIVVTPWGAGSLLPRTDKAGAASGRPTPDNHAPTL